MAYGSIDLGKDFFGLPLDTSKLRRGEFWSLEDISFELKKGDTLGVLGLNGSGKSTLLRLISGIFPPDKGEIEINGSIGSLIAVGAGFHPHMSGRDNIYLNGSILGMSKEEIDLKFDKITTFADIGDFLDAPVSTYSSGMRVRLGFAIAIHREPDILLVDEILSVGDLSFRNKSLRKMSEYRESANGIIFVSHDIEQVRVLCNRLIILDKGKKIYDGDTHKGIVEYESLSRDIRLDNLQEMKMAKRGLTDNETLEVEEIEIRNSQNEKTSKILKGEPIKVLCKFKLNRQLPSLFFYLGLSRDDSQLQPVVVVSNDNMKNIFEDLEEGEYEVEIIIKDHNLAPGVYNPNLGFRSDKTFETYQKIYSNVPFVIDTDDVTLERGFITVEDKWNLKKLK